MSVIPRAIALAGRVGPVALSVAARGAFGIVLAGLIVVRYPASFSVEFFQLLLLQSIFQAFVSGSGYPHAVAASRTEEGAEALVRNYLVFVALTVACAGAALVLVPHRIVAVTLSPQGWKLAILILGAAAIGLHGILQGVLVSRIGSLRTFAPTSVAGLIAMVTLLAWPHAPPAAVYGVFVGYQVGSLVLLVASNGVALPMLRAAVSWGRGSINPIASAAVFGVAAVNTAYLLIFFAFRDWWSAHVPAAASQGAFFGLRLSDTYLQVVVLSAAQANPFRLSGRETARPFLIGLAALAAVAGLSLAATAGILVLPLAVPIIVRCVAAQLVCEAVRFPSSLVNMAQLQTGSPWRYGLTSLPAALLAFALGVGLGRPGLDTIYIFQIVCAALQITAFCLIGLADGRSRAGGALALRRPVVPGA